MIREQEKNIIKKLQKEIPLEKEPFKIIAEDLEMAESELLERIHDLKEQKVLRKLGAILHHRKAGFSHNAMVVWIVPEERCEEAGVFMAAIPQISHCYKRKTFESWPYNLYTMIHGICEEECEAVISKIIKEIGECEYKILYSTKELKKTSVQYFTE